MKNFLLFLFFVIPIVIFSQKISCEETVQLYIIALEDFQSSPLLLHEEDKEMLVTKPWSCQTGYPSKIGKTKVKWFFFDDNLSDILKGDITKHNGRSFLSVSHNQQSPDTVKVRVHQKTLGQLEKGWSIKSVNEKIYPEYRKKNHDFLFVKVDSKWILKDKSNNADPMTPKKQEIEDIFQMGNKLNRLGKYQEALEHVERSMAMDSSAYQRYMFKADIKVKLGMFDSAISDVTKCIERCDCPTRELHGPSYYLKRAEIHLLKGDNSSALEDTNQSILLNPNNYKAYVSRAKLSIRFQKFESALVDLNKAMEMKNNQAEIYLLRGTVNIALGNNKAACPDLEIAIGAGFEQHRIWVEENCKY
jgi:tetratricopeptide (TPR) repeat protein